VLGNGNTRGGVQRASIADVLALRSQHLTPRDDRVGLQLITGEERLEVTPAMQDAHDLQRLGSWLVHH
jgi:hypothetical protein